MRKSGSRKAANKLVVMGSAAVLTVYAAGFVRTRAAAQKMAGAEDRRVAPAPAEAGGSASPAFIEPPARPTSTASATTPRESRHSSHSLRLENPRREMPLATTADTAALPLATTTPEVAPVVEPAPPPAPKTLNLFKDGTYSGWGTSRHGDIQASVVIEEGRIVSASITQCLTRYSCSWISHLPPQVVSRQSAEVDYVSGATQSTNAFYYAIVEALSKAK